MMIKPRSYLFKKQTALVPHIKSNLINDDLTNIMSPSTSPSRKERYRL